MLAAMPVFRLDERIVFPPAELADPDGLLAVGGDLCPERLILAYSSGIFPWPTDEHPLLWHSPDPRFVVEQSKLHVPRSLTKAMRKGRYRCSLDRAFRPVIESCATRPRPGQSGTWITAQMVEAYVALHELGCCHSVEVWEGDELVGGLYGVSLGGAFFGESMFSDRPDASKAGFVRLTEQLGRWDIDLIDSQVHTTHMERFGAEHWPRPRYLERLTAELTKPTHLGLWQLDAELRSA